jgi:hypothetical protein
MTLREAVEHAKAQLAERHKAMTSTARKLAGQGRGNDTEVAHVAREGGRIGKRKAFI